VVMLGTTLDRSLGIACLAECFTMFRLAGYWKWCVTDIQLDDLRIIWNHVFADLPEHISSYF
jgi:hypothetical protein